MTYMDAHQCPRCGEHFDARFGHICKDLEKNTMRYPDYMLDIETLGKGPSAAVVQIGICGFDLRGGAVGEPQSWRVRPHRDSVMDYDTVRWWMQQSQEARDSVFFGGDIIAPEVALQQLGLVIGGEPSINIWAMPPEFDVTIMASLYRMCGLNPPWAYNATRDLRTLGEIAGATKSDRMQPTILHDAGADAAAQASTAIKFHRMLQQRFAINPDVPA